VRTVLTSLYQLLARLNGFGLFFLGILDSSFLFLPFGNDLLLVTMTAREQARLPYFPGMATAGSLVGCLVTDIISRKGGEAELLAIVALGRFGRFFVEGVLAVLLGKRILRWAQSTAWYYTVLGILALSLVGTGFSLYSWFRHSTTARLQNNQTA